MPQEGNLHLEVATPRSSPAGPHHLRSGPRRRGVCGYAARDLVAADVGWDSVPASDRCRTCDELLQGALELNTVEAHRRRHDDRQRLLAAMLRSLDEMDEINRIARRSENRADLVHRVTEQFGFAEDEVHHILDMPVWRQTCEARRALEDELELHRRTRP